jgi:hypothetical protein
MITVCMLSIILLSDEMAELAFQIDLFRCCACPVDLQAEYSVRFPFENQKYDVTDVRMKTWGTLKQCLIQEQIEGL